MSFDASQQFCVRWNSHLGSLGAAFPQLLADQRFVDVTLACEGHQLHCHRLVLAACSTYFESLLGEYPDTHPIIILPRDIRLWEIQALVDFMYKGEVNVSQTAISDLLKCAELLQIRGLCGTKMSFNMMNSQQTSHCEMNDIVQNDTSTVSASVSPTCVVFTSPSSPMSSVGDDILTTQTISRATFKNKITKTNQNKNNMNKRRNVNNHKCYTIKKSETTAKDDDDQHVVQIRDDHNPNDDDVYNHEDYDGNNSCNELITDTGHKVFRVADHLANITSKLKNFSPSESEDYTNMEYNKLCYDDDDVNNKRISTENGTDDQENPAHGKITKIEESVDVNEGNLVENERIHVEDEEEKCNHKCNDNEENVNSTDNERGNNKLGRIRVKAKENLYENYVSTNDIKTSPTSNCSDDGSSSNPAPAAVISSTKRELRKLKFMNNSNDDDTAEVGIDGDIEIEEERITRRLPPSLKFNKNSMTIYVKPGQVKTDECSSINMMEDEKFNIQQLYGMRRNKKRLNTTQNTMKTVAETTISSKSRGSSREFYHTSYKMKQMNDLFHIETNLNNVINNSTSEHRSVVSDNDNKDTKDITGDVASLIYGGECQVIHEDDHTFENVVCSPNVMQITYDEDDEFINKTEILGDTDYDDIQIDESVYGSGHNSLPTLIPYDRKLNHDYLDNDLDVMPTTSTDLSECILGAHGGNHKKRLNTKNSKGISDNNSMGNKSNKSNNNNHNNNNNNNTSNNKIQRKSIHEDFFNGVQTPCAVVLRNPRSNQPRTYNTDALYAALMDVKSGESIYRASQMHKVPRKTLRNWMKRWHIKSAYPMPRQLKQAAEKKRLKQLRERQAFKSLHNEKHNNTVKPIVKTE